MEFISIDDVRKISNDRQDEYKDELLKSMDFILGVIQKEVITQSKDGKYHALIEFGKVGISEDFSVDDIIYVIGGRMPGYDVTQLGNFINVSWD